MSADPLAAAIAAVTTDPGLLARIDDVLERGGRPESMPYRWDAGGCLILAEAIRRVVGGELFAVCDEVDPDENEIAGEPDLSTIDHVVVALPDDRYADTFGVHDLDGLFDAALGFGFVSPVLYPLVDHADPLLSGIIYDEALTAEVAQHLEASLR